MGEFSCCIADELVLVLPGIAPARVGVARVRYTPGGTSSPRAAIGLDELTSPLASQSCRSTRPGCEQLSPPAGSMGEFSCCTADELVLVPPRRHRLKLASPGGHSLCRSTRPGCEQLSPPAGSRGESSCCTADELVLVPPRRHRLKLASPGGHSLVGAPAPGANSVARLLARWASSPAASRTSWCSSLPGGTGLSSPLPGGIVL